MYRLLATIVLIASAATGSSGLRRRSSTPPEFREGMPFSPGVQVGDTLYCAGQTGSDLKTGQYPADFEQEVHQTFNRIGIILKAAGFDFSDAVDVKVYLTDISLFQEMNSVYTQYFEKDRPAERPLPLPA